MKRHGMPSAMITDGLRSYAPFKELGAQEDQESGRWLSEQAENSHLPSGDESGPC